jgi:replicative DNA helicase
MVVEAARRRQLAQIAHQALAAAHNPAVEVTVAITDTARDVLELAAPAHRRGAEPLHETAWAVVQELQDARDNPQPEMRGLPTGLPGLDDVTGGLRGGRLVILAARPGKGKSVLGGQIARHCAEVGPPAIFFALEMDREELAERTLAGIGRVNHTNISRRAVNEGQLERLSKQLIARGDLPLYVDDTPGYRVEEIAAVARREHQRLGGLGLIVVDYLQLVTSDNPRQSKADNVGDVGTALKHLARELDVPVIALAQLSRNIEHRADPRPVLADLRDSGRLEQDADQVWFIHSLDADAPGGEEATDLLIVAKHRGGEKADIPMRFLLPFQMFEGTGKLRHLSAAVGA